jgi:protein-tyrosine phosphatase
VPDLHAPLPDDMERLTDIVVGHLRAGSGVVVHCGAGIGRAGTLAVAVLTRMGSTLDDALSTVATHRPGAGPEVGEQRRVVEALATRWT